MPSCWTVLQNPPGPEGNFTELSRTHLGNDQVHDSREGLQQLSVFQASMAGQMLQHCQSSLDNIGHVALQPRHGQLLHYHGDCCYPPHPLRPLVRVAAVDEARHELIYDGRVVICNRNAASVL